MIASRRIGSVPGADERCTVAPLPLIVTEFAGLPPSRPICRSAVPLPARATLVNVYVPPVARLIVSGWLFVLTVLTAAISAAVSPSGMLNTAGVSRSSRARRDNWVRREAPGQRRPGRWGERNMDVSETI